MKTLDTSELATVVRALRYWCYRAEAEDPAHELLAQLDGTCNHPRYTDEMRGRGCSVCGYSSRGPSLASSLHPAALPVKMCGVCEEGLGGLHEVAGNT